MAAHDTSSSGSVDRIDVSFPLRTAHVATLRVVAASLGADAGFSIDEIDDIRLGLSEVLAGLAENGSTGEADRVTASFAVRPGELEVVVRPERFTGSVEFDDLAAGILRSVVDSCEISADGVTLIKRATENARNVDA